MYISHLISQNLFRCYPVVIHSEQIQILSNVSSCPIALCTFKTQEAAEAAAHHLPDKQRRANDSKFIRQLTAEVCSGGMSLGKPSTALIGAGGGRATISSKDRTFSILK